MIYHSATPDDDITGLAMAHEMADSITKAAHEIPVSELENAYREIYLSPLMALMLRKQVGICQNGDMVDVLADDSVEDSLVEQIRKCNVASILSAETIIHRPGIPGIAEALLIASRYVVDKSACALLSSKEVDIMVAGMSMAFGRLLHAMVIKNHPGNVQGTA